MRVTLARHPESPATPFVDSVEVEVERDDFGLRLEFVVQGDTRAIAVPEAVEAGRRDALWRTTCFEAFVMGIDGGSYVELNLSPSKEWAAYAFDGYRDRMRILEPVPDPEILAREDGNTLELSGTLDVGDVPFLSIYESWRIGVSAVIEARNGDKSYWAVKHPPGAPDFHHRDCFALELPPPNPA